MSPFYPNQLVSVMSDEIKKTWKDANKCLHTVKVYRIYTQLFKAALQTSTVDFLKKTDEYQCTTSVVVAGRFRVVQFDP